MAVDIGKLDIVKQVIKKGNGDLKEKIFIDKPPSIVKFGNEHKIYKLTKILCGLKQAPWA